MRYYVPAEARARRVVLPFPPEDWDALRELLPDADWIVPQRGTAQRWLELADHNARHLLESLRIESFETEERAEDPVYALGRDLGLSSVPRSLVCIDISHNQGKDTVGSLVWFEAGRPQKSEYRKFKIEGAGPAGRLRRDSRSGHPLPHPTARRGSSPIPDLLLIDGGKGQLNAALEAAERARVRRTPVRQPGQAGGGSVPARAGRTASGFRAGARRSGCCSGSGTRRTGSASPTTASAAPSGRSPRSCSTSPASGPAGAGCCWSGSAAWPA